MSIATAVTSLQAKVLAAYAAALNKGATIPELQNLANLSSTIGSIPQEGGGSGGVNTGNDVLFRDYDGKVLYSYAASDISSMSSLPPLPNSPGLSCQGWNWTLQQVKDYVAAYGKCEIGATYTTDDGKTRIKLIIQDPKYTSIPIVFKQTTANGVKVNWGDGSADLTYSGTSQQTISHTYAPSTYPATYSITFEVTSGAMSFPSYIIGMSEQSTTSPRNTFMNMIDKVNIGDGVTSIGSNAFYNCYSLASVTIPSSVTSIGDSAFYNCNFLASITIPSSVTSIGNNTFYNCNSLVSITIPSSMTSIGSYAFYNCNSLASITIPSSMTSIGSSAFYSCNFLASITIPSSVTSIGSSAFTNCNSLASITILNSMTSIGSYAFYDCNSLVSITIPSSMMSIGDSAFYNCFGLKTFDFRQSTSIPTLSNVNAFRNTPTVKEIVVPDELYDTWIAATNWNSTTNLISTSIIKASESSLGPLQS